MMNKTAVKILYILLLLILFASHNNILLAQEALQYKTFIVKGSVTYLIQNFQTPFKVIDNSIIPKNCKLAIDKNSYLEIHSKKDLIRIFPSTSFEMNNNIINLLYGTIYINTIESIKIKIGQNEFIIYKGKIAIKFSKEVLFDFLDDSQIEFNSQIFKPTKTDRIFLFKDGNLQKSKEKFNLNELNFFFNQTNKKIEEINNLSDIFFERIFHLLDKNNSFLEKIENSEEKSIEIENRIKDELENIKITPGSDISQILVKYSEVYLIIQQELIEYNFNRTHYLEFYYQMKNYFEYFKRLIEFSNDIYDLDLFGEFIDYSSKSSFLIAYNKIKSFSQTIKLSYEFMEVSYVNILNSNSMINKNFQKIEILKEKTKNLISDLIKNSYTNMPKDLNNIIIQTFLTQVESKSFVSIYLNKLYEILMTLQNEYSEDESIMNKFFSLDDIIYKSLYLQQAQEIKTLLIQNFNVLDKNIMMLKYLANNSNLFNDSNSLNLLYSIIQFYTSYEDDYHSIISLAEEIEKSYNNYLTLLKYFMKKNDVGYYQDIFAREVDKYLVYIESIQKEIFELLKVNDFDFIYLNSLVIIQEKIISITYRLYDFLKTRYNSIQFHKKMSIDQQKEYLKKLKNDIQNKGVDLKLQTRNEEIKKYLIVRVVAINQILFDISSFKEAIKDYKYQKDNIEKALILYNLSLSNKSSFSSSNYKENIRIITQTNLLLFKIDEFLSKLDFFENELKVFFEEIQNFYLMQSYTDEDIDSIKNKVLLIQKYYNEFTMIFFELIENIYNFSIMYTQNESNNNDILILDIIKDLKTLIFLYKTKIESFKYPISILRIIFSID